MIALVNVDLPFAPAPCKHQILLARIARQAVTSPPLQVTPHVFAWLYLHQKGSEVWTLGLWLEFHRCVLGDVVRLAPVSQQARVEIHHAVLDTEQPGVCIP